MAKSPQRANPRPRRRWGLWVLAIIALAVASTATAFRKEIKGYGSIASAYSARVACSCRYVAGRDLKDCAKDKLAGMEAVTLVEDEEAKSVTARFPLVASATATYRKGYGCVLEPWEG
ncbi:hypothetical protein ACLBKU_06235 [Erythrobacter sp. NE805]|uniref:hypothetical protein n=1 Tax=Erythrobacter sp. NE805 TaxID=3389875 RepID=UPI00396B1199